MRFLPAAIILVLAFCAFANAEEPAVDCLPPAQAAPLLDQSGKFNKALLDPVSVFRHQLKMAPVDWTWNQSALQRRARDVLRTPISQLAAKTSDRIRVDETYFKSTAMPVDSQTAKPADPGTTASLRAVPSTRIYNVEVRDGKGNPVAHAQVGKVFSGLYAGQMHLGDAYHSTARIDVRNSTVVAHDGGIVVAQGPLTDRTQYSLMIDHSTRVCESPWGLGYAMGVGGGVSVTSQQSHSTTRFSLTAAPAVNNVHGASTFTPIVGASFELGLE